jgi:hypothetical protein
MARGPLTYSQALRVVGQRLVGISFLAFELSKRRDEYVARLDPCAAARTASIGKIASGGSGPNIFGDRPGEVPLSFRFTPAELRCYNDAQGLRRTKPGALPNINHLSVALRVLGGYLDRNTAADFSIFWSKGSVKVCYVDKQQLFTAQNLYDLGIVMYLRRSEQTPMKFYECQNAVQPFEP